MSSGTDPPAVMAAHPVLLLWLALFPAVFGSGEKERTVETYYKEHEVSQAAARGAAVQLVDQSGLEHDQAAGCLPCSDQEKRYCLSSAVVADHCCCDKKYHEALPYVPHSCYLSSMEPCAAKAENCGDYQRLRTCCCNDLLRIKYTSAAPIYAMEIPLLTCTMLATWIFKQIATP